MKHVARLLFSFCLVSAISAASSEVDRRSFVPVLNTKKDPTRAWAGKVQAYGISSDGKYSVFKSNGYGLAAGEVGLGDRLYFKSISGKNFTTWDPGKLGIAFASTYKIDQVVASSNCRYSLVWLSSNFLSGRLVFRWDAFSNRVVDFGAVFPELAVPPPQDTFLSDDGNRLTQNTPDGIWIYDLANAAKRLIPPSQFSSTENISWIHSSANGQFLAFKTGLFGGLYRLRLSDDQQTLIYPGYGYPGGVADDGRYFVGMVYGFPGASGYQIRRFDIDAATSIPVARRPDGPELAADEASFPVLSTNGRWAGFSSTNPDLSGLTNRRDHYIRDLQTGNLIRVTETMPSVYWNGEHVIGVANNGKCVFSEDYGKSAWDFVPGEAPSRLASPVKLAYRRTAAFRGRTACRPMAGS